MFDRPLDSEVALAFFPRPGDKQSHPSSFFENQKTQKFENLNNFGFDCILTTLLLTLHMCVSERVVFSFSVGISYTHSIYLFLFLTRRTYTKNQIQIIKDDDGFGRVVVWWVFGVFCCCCLSSL